MQRRQHHRQRRLKPAIDNYEEGFDFNENNAGDLRVDMHHVEASGNGEEGIDYEEDDDFAGGGDIVTTMTEITANGNGQDGDAGLKIREKGVGKLECHGEHVEATDNATAASSSARTRLVTWLRTSSTPPALANGGHGIDFDENSGGDLTATVSHSTSCPTPARAFAPISRRRAPEASSCRT